MSREIEERVVAMKLQNSQFEASAKKTLGTLGDLAKGLKLENAAKGLNGITSAAKAVNLGPLSGAVDGVSKGFSALSVIGVTALATIANKAVNTGLNLAKSLAISPLTDGFAEYELKMGSIQTMLANTARYGTKLPEITKNLEELNEYSDKTIYNFGDMTKNIGLFTNAGIKIGDATKMIQGFSNVAAASGTTAQGAASAAYQLSQALSAGKITLMDWRSLTNVGMGNKNMQESLLQIATAMGTLKEGSKTAKLAQRDFNGSLKDGWLTADVMSRYLRIMAADYGSMSDKELAHQKVQLKSIGLTDKQIDKLIAQQKMAQKSATEVRTFSQLMGTVKESIGSGWAQSFEIIIGNFTDATALWTQVNDSLGATISKMSSARNAVLTDWAQAGGRLALIEGLKNGWQAIAIILKAVKDAFVSVFPPKTGKQLADMTKTFRDFTAGLKMGGENADRLKRIFAGVFAILNVGYNIVKATVITFFKLFGLAQDGSGGFLELAASVADFVVKIEQWLSTNSRISSFFSMISTANAEIFVPLIAIIGNVAEAISNLVSGDMAGFKAKMAEAFGGIGPLFDGIYKNLTSKVRSLLGNLRDITGIAAEFLKSLGISALKPIQTMFEKLNENFTKLRELLVSFSFTAFNKGSKGATASMDKMNQLGEKIRDVWTGVKEALTAVKDFLGPVADSIGTLFTAVTNKIATFITELNFEDVLAIVNSGMFFMLYKTIMDFTRNLDTMVNTFAGMGDHIKDVMDTIKGSVTDTLTMMQKDVKANIILKIAIALGILALSLKLLSTIDPAKLATAVAAIGVLLFAMTKSMGAMLEMLDTVEGQTPKKMGAILATGGALLLLSAGILLLSVAVKQIASLSWEEMARGLIGTGVLLGALGLFTKFADMEQESLKGATSLVLLAGAIYLLSFSVSKLGEMDQNKLIQGAVAVQALLLTLAGVSQIMGDPKSMKGAAGIIVMAGALALLTPVIITLGLIPYENLAKGLGTLAIALLGLAGVSKLMGSPDTIKGAAGIALMAAALAVLTPAIIALGFVPYENLAKGLGTIAIALLLLAGAAKVMGDPKTMMGAASMLILAAALNVLAPAIILLGQADLSTLALGLGAIAVALALFLAAGLAAMYVAPGLIVLGQSILLLGAAMMLAGAGFALMAAGFATLVALGTAGFAVLTVGFMGLINLIPLAAQQIGLGIIAIAVVISKSGPRLVDAMTTVLLSILRAIQRVAPQFFSTMSTLIMGLVRTIERLVPQIAAAGARMIISLLNTIAKYVGPMAAAATNLMIRFINAIAANVPKLVDAGMKAIITFINGLTRAIDNNSTAMGEAGGRLASAIVRGMVKGISAGIGEITSAARKLASSALDSAKSFLGIHSPSREFAKLGAYSAKGFVIGLDGGKASIVKSVSDLQTMIKAAQKTANANIASLSKRLATLNKNKRKNRKAIQSTTRALAEARAELAKANKAMAVSKTFTDEVKTLSALSDKADAVAKKIEAANKKLEEAKKVRDDYNKSISEKYDDLPDFDKETKLSDYVKTMEEQIVKTQIFQAQLEELRKRGLNDELYKELLEKGTDAMPFVEQILEGGKTSVDQLNTLGLALDKSADSLGVSASKALYQAGVDAAAGLVKGLEKEAANIERTMDAIAATMVKAIKKALGIKSPSRVFQEVGDWSVKGLADGLQKSGKVANKAAADVGVGTIESLRKTLTGLDKVMAAGVDVDPTIRPVLDLSAIRRDSVKMGAILGGHGLSVDSNYAEARRLAAQHSSNRLARDEVMAGAGGDVYNFNQTNNSPKALSDATIYRQTKNQISTMKGARKT